MSKTVLALVAALTLAGCRAPIHLGGEYRARSHDLISKSEKTTLVHDDRWVFFWGIIDTGELDVQWRLERQLRGDECFTDLDVREDTTIGGYIIAWLTGGIVSHHEVVLRGRRSLRAPPVEPY